MSQPVSHSPDIPPWNLGAQPRAFIFDPERSLRDLEQFTLYGSNRLLVLEERLLVEARGEFLDHFDTFENVL